MYLHFKELNKLLLLRLFRLRRIRKPALRMILRIIGIRILVQQAHFPLTDVDPRVVLDDRDPPAVLPLNWRSGACPGRGTQ